MAIDSNVPETAGVDTALLAQGCTSNNKVQGCLCQTFECDPKIWMPIHFGPKIMDPNLNFSRTVHALNCHGMLPPKLIFFSLYNS